MVWIHYPLSKVALLRNGNKLQVRSMEYIEHLNSELLCPQRSMDIATTSGVKYSDDRGWRKHENDWTWKRNCGKAECAHVLAILPTAGNIRSLSRVKRLKEKQRFDSCDPSTHEVPLLQRLHPSITIFGNWYMQELYTAKNNWNELSTWTIL